MRKSKFTESQIVGILSEGDAGLPVAEICRKHGISNALYYQWKSRYSGVSVNELKRVRELESENSRLKKMYAELALDNTAIKDVLCCNTGCKAGGSGGDDHLPRPVKGQGLQNCGPVADGVVSAKDRST